MPRSSLAAQLPKIRVLINESYLEPQKKPPKLRSLETFISQCHVDTRNHAETTVPRPTCEDRPRRSGGHHAHKGFHKHPLQKDSRDALQPCRNPRVHDSCFHQQHAFLKMATHHKRLGRPFPAVPRSCRWQPKPATTGENPRKCTIARSRNTGTFRKPLEPDRSISQCAQQMKPFRISAGEREKRRRSLQGRCFR